MKILITCLIALTVELSAQEVAKPSEPQKKPTNDATAMEGLWVPVNAVLGGEPVPPAVLKTITLRIDGDNYEVTVQGEPKPDQGTCKLNPAANPKTMTVTSTNGPNRGKSYPAIYELMDETFRVCYDLSGEKSPTDFKSSKGTQLYLVTYKRKEK